ncbi:MAG: DUF1275 family protein [Acidobacteriota bacterium]
MAPRDRRAHRILPIGLALVAGYVDAYAVLTFGVFVSFMSGNTLRGRPTRIRARTVSHARGGAPDVRC